jgi:hypothetical protein
MDSPMMRNFKEMERVLDLIDPPYIRHIRELQEKLNPPYLREMEEQAKRMPELQDLADPLARYRSWRG